MSKKRLDTTAIMNELSGGSAFFPNYRKEEAQSPVEKTTPTPELREPDHEPNKATKPSTQSASMLARKHESTQARKHASKIASSDIIEAVRGIVRKPGKEEVLYVRLTKEEKDRLADVTYTYKRQGIKTSDNELMRVSVNALLEDYKANGEQSLLARILAELHT